MRESLRRHQLGHPPSPRLHKSIKMLPESFASLLSSGLRETDGLRLWDRPWVDPPPPPCLPPCPTSHSPPDLPPTPFPQIAPMPLHNPAPSLTCLIAPSSIYCFFLSLAVPLSPFACATFAVLRRERHVKATLPNEYQSSNSFISKRGKGGTGKKDMCDNQRKL